MRCVSTCFKDALHCMRGALKERTPVFNRFPQQSTREAGRNQQTTTAPFIALRNE